jgi:predicted HicB family RNase H-like nuclease
MFNYKDYVAHVQFDDEADIFHGEVINTKDVITFQGGTVKDLKKAFKESVDDYLSFCKERNESPDRPFSGKFNLRLDPQIHRDVFLSAKERGLSLNQWVIAAISNQLHQKYF